MSESSDAVAVVGLALRTAGAQTPEEFWALLRDGREALITSTDEQLRGAGLSDAELADPALVRTRPLLDGIEQFDPGHFGFTPREAALTDPQLRLLLECSHEAMESAAVDPARFDGAISVFAGTGPDSYYTHHLLPRERHDPAARMDHLLGNSKDFVAARIAWSLGLRGPAVNVQAGCATSLVAVHLAAQSLLAGESDLALAGGATVYVPQHTGYRYREGGINSPDGRCRAFSAEADGTTPGDGVAVLALRRLADALADGDPILGILESTAVNNDGSGKAGFAAPDAGAQAEAVAEALGVAGIEADDLDYLEAHGTGTPLGDEIEIAALSAGFEGLLRDPAHRVWIGTHKPNVGDTWAAAGALGLAKVLLSLTHDQLPPSINGTPLNPRIDFDATPFAVNHALRAWPAPETGRPRRAGVHVFGLGGTNAHAIVAQAPDRAPATPPRAAELLPLSARSATQLREVRKTLADYLATHPNTDIRAFAWTLQSGRREHPVRAAFIVTDPGDAERTLRDDSCESSNFITPTSNTPPGPDIDRLTTDEYLAALRTVGHAWLNNRDDIDPTSLRGNHTPLRLAIPGHPYLRHRCWAEPPPPQTAIYPATAPSAPAQPHPNTLPHNVKPNSATETTTEADPALSTATQPSAPGHPRPQTLVPYVAPGSATETTATRIQAVNRSASAHPHPNALPHVAPRSTTQTTAEAVPAPNATTTAAMEPSTPPHQVASNSTTETAREADSAPSAATRPAVELSAPGHPRPETLPHHITPSSITDTTADPVPAPNAATSAAMEPSTLPRHVAPDSRTGTRGAADPAPNAVSGPAVELWAPGHPRPETLPPYVAPSSATETTVTRIWAVEFGFDRIGVRDEFFDLGGHSLLAARIIDRMRDECAVALSVRDLLAEASTPAALAALIETRGQVDAAAVADTAASADTTSEDRTIIGYRGMRIPLSAAQRRMWLFMRLYPTSNAYNIGFPMRLRGTVDVGALRRAVAGLLTRHDVLRTRFVLHEGTPFAVVDEPDEAVDVLMVRDGEHDERTAERWIADADATPFDLGSGPLVRLAFAPAEDPQGPHLMLLCAHHSVADGMSLAILHAELAELYAADLEGRAARLSGTVSQFPDLMLRREDPEQQAERSAALDYWRDRLAGEPAALDLPTDRPRPDTPTFAGHAHAFDLDVAPSAALRALAQRHRASTFALVTAAFITVLHRLTGQTDILAGTVTHGRLGAPERDAVGCFADTVLLRERIDPDRTFSELLTQVRDTVTEALAHQPVAFDELVAELGWDATPNRAPLPQAMVIGQQPVHPIRMGRAEGEPIVDQVDTARFDLVCNVWEEHDRIHGAVTGALDIFAPDTIARIAESISVALESIAAEPDSPIADIAIIAPAQRELLHTQWTGAAHPDSAAVSRTGIPRGARPPALHELVLDAARRTPSAVAVTAGSQTLTYDELLAESERLAYRLLDAGVAPEQIVAVSLPRGIDYVVALLGVLRAGAAFVPVDTGWPGERRRQVLEQAGVSVVIADKPGPASATVIAAEPGPATVGVAAQPSRTVASLEVIDMHDESEPGWHELPEVTPEQVAYVMFTSGSTGTPKGVMIRHGAIGYRLRWQQDLLRFGPADCVLFKAPLGFDISINEIFLPLAVGGRLAIVDAEREADIGHLLEVIERDRVTFFYVVASMLDLILDRRDGAAKARSLRYVWCGGEALTDELYLRFAAAFPDATMFHGYGPAEATIGVACRRYTPSAESEASSGRIESHADLADRDRAHSPSPTTRSARTHAVTMGTPNPGARVYVLDQRMRPAPVGVVGELYIGGLPLGRGYVNAAGRTAESFVADTVSGLPGARLYRTGDLAKFTTGGELLFCGRADHQVKVHGYRVELAEVEAVAMRHPAVRRAAVVLDSDGELAAFCQPDDGAHCDAHTLRQWFIQSVPPFMVPRGITVVDRIPLTTAGKLDRKRLAALAVPAEDHAPDRIAPDGATELTLARIWCAVLGVESVGSNRNFFELGGHSMAMVRVQNLIDAEFDIDIPLLELFEHTTIGQLAARLDRHRAGEPPTAAVRADGDAVAEARRRAEAAKTAQRAAAARRRKSR
ncbi:non-ribosomal peptide synthetase [Nocardia alni]|uniref:non-ribosomal peptide synthetase n=1 Tax=Nocardia alni TaxID=2815723 RepID=UPI001C22C1D3|nr:non-ribosomal peptide synthetase [Nocardia alni]